VYDENGQAIKRVDIGDNKGHGNVEGSHVIEYKVNRDPRTGIERVQPDKSSVREARPDEIP
jgi:Bacterial toxin 24